MATQVLKFLFYLFGFGTRSDTGVAASHNVGLPPAVWFYKAFSFSPIFLFHARKRKMGCGRGTGGIGTRGSPPHTYT